MDAASLIRVRCDDDAILSQEPDETDQLAMLAIG
jgi:hypothetical protein